jgi:hypothetical protein
MGCFFIARIVNMGCMENPPKNSILALIYGITIFTSAFLLFQIQPMISKAILPWFGGTPAVWTTCLLFFQSILFAGYAYAHFSNTWLSRRNQAILHLIVIAVALVMIRVLPGASQQPAGDADPTRAILWILLVTIGLPYFILSATGPLLQAWFADTFPDRTPYRLYALSNVGSLLALLSYPFVFEHLFDLPSQGKWWTAGFIAFGIFCAYVAWQIWLTFSGASARSSEAAAKSTEAASPAEHETPPRWLQYFLWLFLPAFATATLMATINHVCTDTAPVPLLFVVPLALYLLTFIIAFDQPRWYRPLLTAVLTLFAIYGAAQVQHQGVRRIDLYDLGMTGRTAKVIAEKLNLLDVDEDGDAISPGLRINFVVALAVNFLAMFGICMLCHGELTRLRPHKKYLTAFYLMISAGGALGGIAVSLLAPHVFRTLMEWPLTYFIAAIGAVTLVLYALVGTAVRGYGESATPPETSRSITATLALVMLLIPTSYILLDLVECFFSPSHNIVYQNRNFFGTITVREQKERSEDGTYNGPRYAYVLRNGTTIHGSQFTTDGKRGLPTSYYATTSGIGRTLNFFRNNPPPGGLRIGDVGLGTGTLAAYVTKGDFLTFYEINPAVIEMAKSGNLFTYYRDAEDRGAKCDIKLGDARLTLENELKEPNLPRYHVLVLDAFSSDAIPTHLLTIEACKNYLPRIASLANGDGAEGALVIHVSNRYLDLSRVVRATAEALQMPCVEIRNEEVSDKMILTADWMVLTRNEALLDALRPHEEEADADALPPVLWTDARSSLFEILE